MNQTDSFPIRQAVILVGGRGQRLGNLTANIPKPLLEVKGRPFLCHILDWLVQFGIERVLLLAGYKGHYFSNTFPGINKSEIEITTNIEPTPLGTAGALKNSAKYLDNVFILINGDSYFDIDLTKLVRIKKDSNWVALIASRRIATNTRYGVMEISGTKIKEFNENLIQENAIISGGIYILKKIILDEVKPNQFCSLEKDIFPLLAKRGLMYGTIFNLSVKTGHEQDLLDAMDTGEIPDGMIAWFLMKPDDSNSDWIGVAIFESKEAHVANANRPEQHEAFTKMMKHLNSDPTWTDGEYIVGEIA